MLTIKKYPNRKLYDTNESKYITLSNVVDLVNNNTEFTVIDSKTGNDLTNNVLRQVIASGRFEVSNTVLKGLIKGDNNEN